MTAAVDITEFLGVDAEQSPAERISRLRDGLPYGSIERLREALDLSLDELASALGISTRTLSRRKEQDSLHRDESDRVFRIARVFSHATSVFGGAERASRWFKRPNPVLEDMSPIEVFDTDLGAQLVGDLLTRIEYGVHS
jgi:putative toxin-antitoxin system antitoxin component (TIGR02293 family)